MSRNSYIQALITQNRQAKGMHNNNPGGANPKRHSLTKEQKAKRYMQPSVELGAVFGVFVGEPETKAAVKKAEESRLQHEGLKNYWKDVKK